MKAGVNEESFREAASGGADNSESIAQFRQNPKLITNAALI